jgi:hypothetical protein
MKIKTCLQNGFWNHEIKVKKILLIKKGLDNILKFYTLNSNYVSEVQLAFY